MRLLITVFLDFFIIWVYILVIDNRFSENLFLEVLCQVLKHYPVICVQAVPITSLKKAPDATTVIIPFLLPAL